MIFYKKNVSLLLVPLLIIIFFSGNANADTYSFSVSSTFGDLPAAGEVAVPFIYIDIDSSPQGAQIWINDECIGVTPLREYFDRPGDHTFKLSLNGYQHYQESFYISESRTLDVVLEPLEGETPKSPTPPEVPSSPSPTPPGFLALSLLIAIFFVYFFKFKNKR